ncbi:hypothetical protein DFH09DRAFT_1340069 [Mycena vulgaris]|nr:hypothetical protein DFH09DRAFT_1340069 [Mycena vulgaris]
MVHRKCPSKVTFHVPVDPSIRKILIFFPRGVPHNHPVQPSLIPSHETEFKYRKCVQAVGLVGSTIAKVDNAPSTTLILGGHMPGQYAAALEKPASEARPHSRRRTTHIVVGTFKWYQKDLKKADIYKQYIHCFDHKPDGSLIISTCFTALLAILDDPGVKAFGYDTTFT